MSKTKLVKISLLISSFLLFSVPAASKNTPIQLVHPDGSYDTVPLEKDTVVIKIVQTSVNNIQEFDDPSTALKANLDKMIEYAKKACSTGKKPDFILYNEFPLTGYSFGDREEKLKYTINIPGPETKALGEIAKSCDTYLIFGSYAQDAEWPEHILSINTVLDRKGKIAKKFWKTRNVKRIFENGEIPTTTIESVRNKYREKYGIEEEFPVLRTEFGNIAVSTVQLDPLVFAAFAMRGTEIMFRTSTLFSEADVKAIAAFNNFYSAMSNITLPEDSEWAPMGGNSLIVSPKGETMAQAKGNVDAIIEAEIPIAQFRKSRTIPRYPVEVVAPIFSQYQQEIPLNHMDIDRSKLPSTRKDMKTLLDQKSRWINKH
ncbi:carbon-nitrogen hydrolase family protein [Thalassotalea piscium]